MPELVARRWRLIGRVQGVGFRWFALSQAQALGVRGWATNLADGSVEVVALATAETLTAFEEKIRRGPTGSQVTQVTVSDVPHETVDTKSFVIK